MYAVMIPNRHVRAMAKPTVGGDRTTSAAAARSAPRTGGRRRSAGSVSGSRRAQQATRDSRQRPGARTASATARTSRIAAPTLGANTGTSTNVAMMCDIVRAIRSPPNVSRTIASASDRGAAAPRPQITRQTMSTPSDGATAQASALTAIRPSPT